MSFEPHAGPAARSASPAFDPVADLPTEAVTRFQQDGVVRLQGALSPHWIEVLTRGVEANMAAPSPRARIYTPEGSPGRFFGDYCNWQDNPDYRAFMTESPAAAIAGRLMGSAAVRVFHEHVLVKEPGTQEPTPWHHDQPYYVINGRMVMSLWIPLDPVPAENAVQFVAGSHNWGRIFRPQKFTGAGYDRAEGEVEEVPDIEGEREKYDILTFDMEPGDVLAFHALTLHGAPGNPRKTRRRAFAARFLGTDAVYGERSGDTSPPYPDLRARLKTGDPLPEDEFPTVWRA